MYDAPNHPKMTKDQDGKINRNIDDAVIEHLLITDEVGFTKVVHGKIVLIDLDPHKEDIFLNILQLITSAFAAPCPFRSKNEIKKTARHKRGR